MESVKLVKVDVSYKNELNNKVNFEIEVEQYCDISAMCEALTDAVVLDLANRQLLTDTRNKARQAASKGQEVVSEWMYTDNKVLFVSKLSKTKLNTLKLMLSPEEQAKLKTAYMEYVKTLF